MTSPFTSSAKRFRTILIIALALFTVGIITAIFFTVKSIDSYALTVNQNHIEAANIESEINNIKNLSSQLSARSAEVAKVKQIVADSKSYQYQNVIINDLSIMAGKAGVSIKNYDFSTTQSAAAAATPAPSASANTGTSDKATATVSPGAAATPTAASTLRSTTVNITLANPISYDRFLNFLYYIEKNNTKMQISNLSLSLDESNKIPGSITTNSLAIEVYIR